MFSDCTEFGLTLFVILVDDNTLLILLIREKSTYFFKKALSAERLNGGEDIIRTSEDFLDPEYDKELVLDISPLSFRLYFLMIIVIREGKFRFGNDMKEGAVGLSKVGRMFGLGLHYFW